MAKPRITRQLKVYTTRIGIHDWAVAVPNQKEALKAWDVRENLFASGAARVVDDTAVIAAALKTPGVPVIAPGQAKARPTEAKSNVVRLDDRRPKKAAPEPPKKPAVERRAPPPDRSKLDAAENELRDFENEVRGQRKELARRKQTLDREIEAFEVDVATKQRRLERLIERARSTFERLKS